MGRNLAPALYPLSKFKHFRDKLGQQYQKRPISRSARALTPQIHRFWSRLYPSLLCFWWIICHARPLNICSFCLCRFPTTNSRRRDIANPHAIKPHHAAQLAIATYNFQCDFFLQSLDRPTRRILAKSRRDRYLLAGDETRRVDCSIRLRFHWVSDPRNWIDSGTQRTTVRRTGQRYTSRRRLPWLWNSRLKEAGNKSD
jgi:hypothetical protein